MEPVVLSFTRLEDVFGRIVPPPAEEAVEAKKRDSTKPKFGEGWEMMFKKVGSYWPFPSKRSGSTATSTGTGTGNASK